jgi:hypothetical protein
MFEFHMLVVTVVMLNILELIMEIVPNYPTALTSTMLLRHQLKATRKGKRWMRRFDATCGSIEHAFVCSNLAHVY